MFSFFAESQSIHSWNLLFWLALQPNQNANWNEWLMRQAKQSIFISTNSKMQTNKCRQFLIGHLCLLFLLGYAMAIANQNKPFAISLPQSIICCFALAIHFVSLLAASFANWLICLPFMAWPQFQFFHCGNFKFDALCLLHSIHAIAKQKHLRNCLNCGLCCRMAANPHFHAGRKQCMVFFVLCLRCARRQLN